MATKKWIVCIVGVEESKLEVGKLLKGAELGSLPDAVDDAIREVAPHALSLDTVYLLTARQRERLEHYLERHSMPYHEYVTKERGERCLKENCNNHKHKHAVVIDLHDHRKRTEAARRPAQKG